MPHRSPAALLALAIAAAFPTSAALAVDGDDLLVALKLYQESVTKTCIVAGIGLPPPCAAAFPAVPAGKVLQVQTLSCSIEVPTTVKVYDARLVAPNQGTIGIELQRLENFAGKARYRNFVNGALNVPAGQPVFVVQTAISESVVVNCTLVGRLVSPP